MQKFADEWLVCRNQAKAALAAGYAPRSVNIHATRVFNHPLVQEYIKPLLKELTEKTHLSAERVLEEIARVAFANLGDYYKLDAKGKKFVIKELDELTKAQQACISEYAPGKHIKLHSKDSALDKLGKHFKLYTDIDATVNNLVIMPVVSLNGKEVIFDVGRPAPKVTAHDPSKK